MKNFSQIPFVSCLLLSVLGFTLGIVFFFHFKSFSFNLQLSHAQFSIFTSQSLKTRLLRPPPPEVSDDEELLWRASKIKEFPYRDAPKVAFMFLTRGPLILAPLWEMFFKGHRGLYTIYIHSQPSYNATEAPDSVFYGTRIPSKEVEWGNFNMVEAERRLLANALLDCSNQRFVLLSESCIPLFNFQTIYSHLMNSTLSHVQAYDNPNAVSRGRYTRRMMPLIRRDQWRKGTQWFQIHRDLAAEVVSDTTYFPLFQKQCRRPCYGDEHYLPTFATIRFRDRISNTSLTWVDWSRGGCHPSRFYRQHVTPQFLDKLRTANTCFYNGHKTNMCFLFARKFTLHSLDRLLRFAHFN